MKSCFLPIPQFSADPITPAPTPFPIKIVTEPAPAAELPVPPPPPSGKRDDNFYEAWDKFLAIKPKRAKASSSQAKKLEKEKQRIDKTPGDGLQVDENAAKSWQEARDECVAKVDVIVEECQRLNQKYRDAYFDLEANPWCLQGLNGCYPKAVDRIDAPPWIKRVEDIFDDPQFFIDGASATDIHQGSAGDCWFLTALMAVSAKKELIDKLCVARNEKVGVYGFVFYRDGEWMPEVIDDKLYIRVGDDDDLDIVRDWDREDKKGKGVRHDEDKLRDQLQRGGEALYFSHCKSNETWLCLIEKAYAKAHGDYGSIEGGFASEGIEDLTGGVAVVLNPEDIMDKDRFWKEQLSQVNKKYLFGGGTKQKTQKGFVGGHAYAVLQAWEEGDTRLLKLRNPWGEDEPNTDWADGGKLWTADMMTKLGHTFGDDGVFWCSYKDFLKHFPSISRLRLFDDSWHVSQQWTCVDVPWTVDYLDTKFQFTTVEKGPVVLVLSQPDDRYFYGLGGRFSFSLHFKVYREGEEERQLVRSMHNSGGETMFTRSVSAEIEDLEPGTYNVVFKITATRLDQIATPAENIFKFAVQRKEKLLHVGRQFDYAQTKGCLRGAEKAKERRLEKAETLAEKKDLMKTRKTNKQERKRARKRKERIEAAMKVKRRAYELAKKERKRAEKRKKAAKKAKAAKKESKCAKEIETGPKTATDDTASEASSKTEGPTTPSTGSGTTTSDESSASASDSAAAQPSMTAEITQGTAKVELKVSEAPSADVAEEDDDDDEYLSPLEDPEELVDDDFDWDSEIDGPVDESEDEDDEAPSANDAKDDIFGEDNWNALCVLGLRAYSLNSSTTVNVFKGRCDG